MFFVVRELPWSSSSSIQVICGAWVELVLYHTGRTEIKIDCILGESMYYLFKKFSSYCNKVIT